MIRTEGLSERYGSLDALGGLDIEVGEGEVVGFLGPNGAGKTTTIRLLLGLARPTAGRAGGDLRPGLPGSDGAGTPPGGVPARRSQPLAVSESADEFIRRTKEGSMLDNAGRQQ
ncbi:MAG TPA: ATP-binding cassette domain-containing protein [Actinocrinis sp.]|nr:ATP-binding cassette domain-containing protein [Actinocrinis sp.]